MYNILDRILLILLLVLSIGIYNNTIVSNVPKNVASTACLDAPTTVEYIECLEERGPYLKCSGFNCIWVESEDNFPLKILGDNHE